MGDDPEYALLDVGGDRRLERFGALVVDRPAPGASPPRREHAAWPPADARYMRGIGFHPARSERIPPWMIELGAIRLELRLTETGQVGLFPEQLALLPWLTDRVRERFGGPDLPSVLNLFAYTGLATLAMAAAGAAVTHVDGSRPTVDWARRNAELSGLAARPIRWLVDDVPTFIAREGRRGRRYDGLVLDPPSYGHGAGGRPWRLVDDLAGLLDASSEILEPDGFVLLTAHTPEVGPGDLADALGSALGRPAGRIEHGELALEATSGAHLALGAYARSAD